MFRARFLTGRRAWCRNDWLCCLFQTRVTFRPRVTQIHSVRVSESCLTVKFQCCRRARLDRFSPGVTVSGRFNLAVHFNCRQPRSIAFFRKPTHLRDCRPWRKFGPVVWRRGGTFIPRGVGRFRESPPSRVLTGRGYVLIAWQIRWGLNPVSFPRLKVLPLPRWRGQTKVVPVTGQIPRGLSPRLTLILVAFSQWGTLILVGRSGRVTLIPLTFRGRASSLPRVTFLSRCRPPLRFDLRGGRRRGNCGPWSWLILEM